MNQTTAKRTAPDYLSARESIELLGIRQQTLYAYVSRGWIRSVRQPARKDRLYLREDVERVKSRSQARSGHGAAAASAMNWGEPIIPTSITEITADGPRYRGLLAVDLARGGATFESVAELLWTGRRDDEPVPWRVPPLPDEVRKLTSHIGELRAGDRLLEIFAMVALTLGVARGGIAERVSAGRTLDAARQIIQTLTGCFGYLSRRNRYVAMRRGELVVEGLVRALAIPATDENREALQAMLVVFADHELSPGAFAARITASSGGTLHSCIASAICASSGVQVARLYDRVEQFLSGASSARALLARARRLQARGVVVPGFVYPLYPRGDPRGLLLLDIAKRRRHQTAALKAIYDFIGTAESVLGLHPRHELAVATLATAMKLPRHTAGALFSLARTAGWVAHVREQRLSATLLRPRAKFVGG